MNAISEPGLRVAMLDTLLQQDQARERALIEKLRDKNAELTRLQREMKRIANEVMVIQRQQASIHDALALELCR